MIQKQVSISLPFNDSKVIQVERMFTTLFDSALQSRTGTYTGDGKASRTVSIGIKALFVYIQRNTAGAYAGVFTIRDTMSYIPGTGIVSNAVTAFGVGDITLGSHVSVNEAGASYKYFAIG